MDFENIEIGLLNRNSTLPSKESVLERFQDGLASRLRGEPVGNESESAEHPKDDYAEGSGFTEEGAESVDSV